MWGGAGRRGPSLTLMAGQRKGLCPLVRDELGSGPDYSTVGRHNARLDWKSLERAPMTTRNRRWSWCVRARVSHPHPHPRHYGGGEPGRVRAQISHSAQGPALRGRNTDPTVARIPSRPRRIRVARNPAIMAPSRRRGTRPRPGRAPETGRRPRRALQRPRAAPPADSGPEPVSGPKPDSMREPDSMPEPDSVPEPDSMPEPDSGLEPDSGPEPDFWPEQDSGPEPDSGPPGQASSLDALPP